MFPLRLQIYKKVLKPAIPRNEDAEVYQLLSIARYFKTPYLCTRNLNSAVMLATPEWIVLCSYIYKDNPLEVETASRQPHFSFFVRSSSIY